MRILRPAIINDAAFVSSNVPETVAAYNAGTTYAVSNQVRSDATHRLYESVQAGNTGHSLDDPAWWADIGPTNRWAMFDQVVGTQTTGATGIDVRVEPPGRVDSLALLNVDAATVRVVVTAPSPTRTNLLSGSADFTTTYWSTVTNITVSADNTAAPDGTVTAEKLADTATNSNHRLRRNHTFAAAVAHTFSVYVKRDTHRWFRLFVDNNGVFLYANFDLLNDVVGSKHADVTSTITDVGAGWYRCTLTAVMTASASTLHMVMLSSDYTNVTENYAGTATSLWLWGAQLETGNEATEHIPTTTAAASSSITTVFDQSYSMTSGSGVNNWYSYFYEPIVRKTDLIITDIPLISTPEIRIVADASGSTCSIGVVIAGLSRILGSTSLGAGVGITDYSIKSADDFGNYTITERAFARKGTFQILVDAAASDEVFRILSTYRATPTLYIGSDDYVSTAIYGFFRDFNIELSYPLHHLCSLEIEGLT